MNHFSVDNLIMKANSFAKKGKNNEAIEIFQSILKKFPNNVRAQLGLKKSKEINITNSNPSNEIINDLYQLYSKKELDLLLNKAKKLLNEFPNSFVLWNILGILKLEDNLLNEAATCFQKATSLNPLFADGFNNLGNIYKKQGMFEQAIFAYKKSLEIKPENANAHYNLGSLYLDKEILDEAEINLKKSILIEKNNSKAYHNLGLLFQKQKKFDLAIRAYDQSLIFDENNYKAHNNLGKVFQITGKYDIAKEKFNKSILINPNYSTAYNNLGTVLNEEGRIDEAIKAYKNSIALKSDYSEAYNNLGSALQKKGDTLEAIKAFKKSIEIKRDYSEAYNNLGVSLQGFGDLNGSFEAYKKSILIKNDNHQAWHNIYFVMQCLKQNFPSTKNFVGELFKNAQSYSLDILKLLLNYKLKRSSGIDENYLQNTLKLVSKNTNYTIKNLTNNRVNKDISNILPTKVISLVHFGRSGTGLLHSLIDHHEQISTLPGIYFSEYFDYTTWEKITANGWDSIVDNFISIYDVLFDASSNTPILSKGHRYIRNIGYSDGFTNLGKNHDEILKLDNNIFKQNLNELISYFEELNPLSFFKLIHIAYEKTLKNYNKKDIIFYHIHNPDIHAQLNLTHLDTNHNWIVMVREPIQSCESWIKNSFQDNDYSNCAMRITTMLLDIDNIIYTKNNSIGLRLEDLKKHPKKTIKALCNWMEIEENQNLYEMTMQGKKWWGDPTSPDYLKDGMKPFGQTSIERKIGLVFTKRDQLILKTLFYPFNVRFGYIKEDAKQFKKDLKTIRPMLDELFDFEKTIIDKTKVCNKDFMKSGSYLSFRSILIERWDLLNKHYTYKNMIRPLNIN